MLKMGIFERFFASNQQKEEIKPISTKVETPVQLLETPIEDSYELELKELKKQGIQDKNRLIRERLQLENEKKRLEIELESQRIQLEIEKVKQERERLTSYDDDDDDDDEEDDSPDKMLMTLFSTVLAKNNTPIQQPAPYVAPVVVEQQNTTITDAQIQEYWVSLSPAIRQAAKSMNDESLKAQLSHAQSTLTETDKNKIVQFVRSQ